MSSSSNLITITIQNPYLPDYHYEAKLQPDSTILSLKQYLSSHYAPSTSPSHCHPSITSQRLVCAGRLVSDHELIGGIGKQQSSDSSSSSIVLHLLIKPQENITSTPTTIATSSDVPTSTPLTSPPVTSTSTCTSPCPSSSPTCTPEQIATYYQQLATYQHAYLQYLQSMYPFYHPYPYGMIPPTMGLRQRHTGHTESGTSTSNTHDRNATAHPFLEQYALYMQQQHQQVHTQPQPQAQQQQPQQQQPQQQQPQQQQPQQQAQAQAQAPAHQPEPAVAAPAAAGIQHPEPVVRPQPAYMRYIDIKLIGKMAMLMMLFGQDGDIHRLSILFILCVFAYLYQVGILRRNGAMPPMGDDEDEDEVMAQQRGFGAAGGGGAGGQRREEIPEPVVAGDPNVVDPAAPPRPTGMLVNIEKFIVGFFASLVPTWNPPPP